VTLDGLFPRSTRQRSLVALIALVITVVALLGPGLTGVAGAQASTPADMEREFLELVNRERTARGLNALVPDAGMAGIARDWSAHMSGTHLHHRPDLRAQVERRVTTQWQRIGENVGRGSTVSGLHQAFMNSPSHFDNVVGRYNRLGVGVVLSNGTTWVTFNFLEGPALAAPAAAPVEPPRGDFWVATAAGDVRAFGTARSFGSLAGQRLNRPIVGMAAAPKGDGYWLVASDGGIFSYGTAAFLGSTGAMKLNQPIVGMAPTPSGKGYYLVASDGGIFTFGDAVFRGSTGAMKLNKAILGMATTPDGGGYWLTASDGGIFAFGNAAFAGSTGGIELNQPVTSMASTPSGKGYWLVAADGGIFNFGDAPFLGSAGGRGTASPVTGLARTTSGAGYSLVTRDGSVLSYGDAGTVSSGPLGLGAPVVALALAG
jgi:hypothetical protein